MRKQNFIEQSRLSLRIMPNDLFHKPLKEFKNPIPGESPLGS
jgi:hypothetical protein